MHFESLLTPSVLFFALGMFAQLIRSDLKLPPDLIKSMTVYLLLGIGIHGGAELAHASMLEAVPALLAAFGFGLLIPLLAYWIIHHLGKLDRLNAVAIASHYGSVSAGTFLTAIAFLEAMAVPYEKYPVVMLAVMESPAILVGLLLANWVRRQDNPPEQEANQHLPVILKESFTNGSIILLAGGLLIGDMVPDNNLQAILPFFNQMFMGILCVFLLAMGMEAGKKLNDFKKAGAFLVSFGVLMPVLLGGLGVLVAHSLLGFSAGGATLVAVLVASASYIAVPPAMRIAIPEANPSLYLTLSLGVTFPFNVLLGIPLYYQMAQLLTKG
ncbi:sodium-dependent bicarbonate transport family permease [Methylophilus aquaticus]|uniref:Sodium-dependent bicarbonate transport family permease n=1 Tax=Methylophilus aquaticus TaxID=1971610 RepID=A0ABT9JTZ3_9PROT|nr:sodium-dependent bicarbonate transport family permease [Methylophilus aquaticus]MDP8568053.1 sodium-dependent bicarbonate transport family permease [Methylophilus aquaticus]